MRIAIVSGAYLPQMNGVVTTILNTVNELERRGHEILILSPKDFWGIPCPGYDLVRLAIPTRKFFRMLDAFAPDVLHFATECPLGWMGKLYAKLRGFRFSTAYHTQFPQIGAQVANEKFHLPHALALRLGWQYIHAFHRGSSAVMVALPALRGELAERGFKNLVHWSRGIDHKTFHPNGPRLDLGPRPIFMYYGRVSIDKNIPAFLGIDLPGTKVVVGEGPAKDVERWKMQYPNVRFLGRKDGDERGIYLRSADVKIFPSKTDTFGLVIPESNACGVPVAAPDIFPQNDLVRNGINGWVDNDLRIAALRALEVDRTLCVDSAREFTWKNATDQFLLGLVAVRT